MATRRSRRLLGATAVLGAVALLGAPAWWTTQPVWVQPSRGSTVHPARLEADVRELTREPRDSDAVARLDAISAWLVDEFTRAGATAATQAFTPSRAAASHHNVVARLGPRSDDVVVVGARYDAARGQADPDAALGVAALLALAGSLSSSTLGVGVELVAFSLGAPPYFGTVDMGSSHHARAAREQRRGVRAMLSLEGLGCFTGADRSQRFPRPLGLLYPSRGDFVAVVGRHSDWRLVRAVKRAMSGATELPVWSLSSTRRLGRVDAGDHQSYWAHGFHAVMITDTSPVGWRACGADADGLDYRRAAMATSALHAAVVDLAR